MPFYKGRTCLIFFSCVWVFSSFLYILLLSCFCSAMCSQIEKREQIKTIPVSVFSVKGPQSQSLTHLKDRIVTRSSTNLHVNNTSPAMIITWQHVWALWTSERFLMSWKENLGPPPPKRLQPFTYTVMCTSILFCVRHSSPVYCTSVFSFWHIYQMIPDVKF